MIHTKLSKESGEKKEKPLKARLDFFFWSSPKIGVAVEVQCKYCEPKL